MWRSNCASQKHSLHKVHSKRGLEKVNLIEKLIEVVPGFGGDSIASLKVITISIGVLFIIASFLIPFILSFISAEQFREID